MAQITIEVPDEFAQRLEPFQAQLPELFTRFLAINLPGISTESTSIEDASSQNETHQEILNFLISQPTSQQIVDFKVSEHSQQRLRTLLEKNREFGLSSQEEIELDVYEQLDTLMVLLKAKAFSTLRSSAQSPV